VSIAWIRKLEDEDNVVSGDVVLSVASIKQFIECVDSLAVAATRPRVEPFIAVVMSISTMVACQWLNIIRSRSCQQTDRQTDTQIITCEPHSQ